MDTLTSAAASGLRARMESLDMLANNLANASTAGFKADREFYTLYADAEAQAAEALGASPMAPRQPLVDRPWVDLAQGTLLQTGNPLDLGLSGPGFFVVQSPSGPLYTRSGSFQISAAGEAVTADGYKLMLQGGQPLRPTAGVPLEISKDGLVQQAGQTLGRLEIAELRGSEAFAKVGNNYFQAGPRAAAPSSATQVHQGKLEGSNVTPAESAVRLVSVMRQFEMLQRAVSLGGDMNRRALEEVAKPA